MPITCARCASWNPDVARYCRNCGLSLRDATGSQAMPGRSPHPQPLPAPPGSAPITGATDLYFQWEAAGGGRPLLGTETLVLRVFNGGYDLAHVVVHVRGMSSAAAVLFGVDREIEELPRGQSAQVEIPSWELPDPVSDLTAALVSAEFLWPAGPQACP